MKRALVLSLVLHLVVLILGAVWFQGTGPGPRRLAVTVHSVFRPAAPSAVPAPQAREPQAPSSSPLVAEPHDSSLGAPALPEVGQAFEPELQPATAAEALSGVVSGEGAGAIADRPAALVTFEQPAYPREARRRGWEGVVTVEVLVDAAGRWASASVAQSSGRDVLDRAALGALRTAVFRPAVHAGQPEAGAVTARVRFQLQ